MGRILAMIRVAFVLRVVVWTMFTQLPTIDCRRQE
jgi:hypothetical protein